MRCTRRQEWQELRQRNTRVEAHGRGTPYDRTPARRGRTLFDGKQRTPSGAAGDQPSIRSTDSIAPQRPAGWEDASTWAWQWRSDAVLQAAVEQAKEAAADLIEAEAFRRAVEGWEEPVGWYQGRPGGMVRKYSDVLAIFLLKGLRPDRYKDRVEMRGAIANLDLNQLPDEAIERIARGEHIMSVLASMVPRAGEAVPGLLALPEEPE